MRVLIDNRNKNFSYTNELEEKIRQAIAECLKLEKLGNNFEISISFVDEDEIKYLNKTFRKVDRVTDVLSFPTFERGEINRLASLKSEEILLGDVVICVNRANKQAEEFGHSLKREIIYLTVHSIFHLLGYDHMKENEKVIMRSKEKAIMKKLGIFKNESSFGDMDNMEFLEGEDVEKTEGEKIENDEVEEVEEARSEYQDESRDAYLKKEVEKAIDSGRYGSLQAENKNKDFGDSFHNAVNGILFAVKNESNMKFDIIIALAVIIFAFFFDFSRVEMAIITIMVILVLMAEMFNTAIENVTDLACEMKYNKLAKIAKDVGAGAVLFTTIGSAFVGYLIFYDRIFTLSGSVYMRISKSVPHSLFTVVAFILILVIVLKAIFYKGNTTALRGGSVSGHSALAFALANVGSYLVEVKYAKVMFFALAFLVAESRVEAKIHTLPEIFLGGLLGILVSSLVFRMF